jgi:outer membrane receptor protein involved in Fe transport
MGNISLMGLWSEDPITMPDYYKYANDIGRGNADKMIKTQGGWNFNAEANTTFGANTFLVARFSMKRTDLNLQSEVKTGIRYQQSGYYWGAGDYDYISKRDHNQYQVNLNHFMDTSFGYHDIKVGAELYKMNITNPMHYYMPGLEYIRYNNQGLTYQRFVYEPQVYRTAKEYGDIFTLFFQDKWEITKGLTLNLGIRAEQANYKNDEKASVLKFKFGNMLAPRLGAAYSFGKNK